MRRSSICGVALAVMIGVLFVVCDDDEDDGAGGVSSYTYGGTQAPGDYWEWTIDRGAMTFTADSYGTSVGVTLLAHYEGTIEILPSLFLKGTITATTDPDAAVDDVGYIVEIPGAVILSKPVSANESVVAATCIGGTVQLDTYNFIMLPVGSFSDTSMAYGSTEITAIAATTVNQTVTSWDWVGTQDVDSTPADAEIVGSMIYIPTQAAPTAVGVMTPSGCFVTDTGASGGNVGAIKPANPIDVADLISKEYRGFDTLYLSPAESVPSWMSPSATSDETTGGGFVGSTPEGIKDTTATGTLDFSGVTQPIDGILTGITMSAAAGAYTQDIVMVVGIVQGKYVIFAMAKDNAGDWATSMLMEQ